MTFKPPFYLLFCFFALPCAQLDAQLLPGVEDEIAGFWIGILKQNEGGYADQFELTLNLEARGGVVDGTAYVALGDIKAEMAITGQRLPNGSWSLWETRIIRSEEPEHLSWCLKGFELTINWNSDGDLVLSGPWWGNTQWGPCVPGYITLKRPKDRA
ncbi:MAG: hypothetical protein AAF433_22850 [Bacteroidota bacterium]